MKNIFTYSFYQRNPVFFTAYCTALYTYPQNEEKKCVLEETFYFLYLYFYYRRSWAWWEGSSDCDIPAETQDSPEPQGKASINLIMYVNNVWSFKLRSHQQKLTKLAESLAIKMHLSIFRHIQTFII